MAPKNLASKAELKKMHEMYSDVKEKNRGENVLGNLVTIAVNVAILYYVVQLEQEKCKCIRDWRHTYIKIYTIVMLIFNVLRLFGKSIFSYHYSGPKVNAIAIAGAVIALLFLAAVGTQIYALFTYVGDLNKTKCLCATEDMRALNRAMLIIRWFYLLGAGILSIVFLGMIYLRFIR